MRRVLTTLACVAAVAGFCQSAEGLTYEVTIEDMMKGGPATGQPLTPPVAVVHGPGYSLFAPGAAATPGLEILAEEGMTVDLVAEANSSGDVYEVAVGGGPFFETETFTIDGEPGDRFSVVTMLARSNDLITGLHDIVLPVAGVLVFEETNVYDAGTEMNTGLVEHIPFYGNAFAGPDEGGVVTMISGYSILDDPDEGVIEYEFPPSARITIEVVGPTATQSETWGSIKTLYGN